MKLQFSKANRFIPFLLFLGIALGLVEIFMGSQHNNIQVILIHLLTTFLIGYSMLIILLNHKEITSRIKVEWIKNILLLTILIVVALIASEVEVFFRTVVFDNEPYKFLSGGKIYMLNALITTIVGFGSYMSIKFPWPWQEDDLNPKENIESAQNVEPISQIPLKKGDNIFLLHVDRVAFIEAFDNYSMVYDLEGNKQLCDFSLRFLESRLNQDFIRIHRKHIINKNQIAKIQPHLNGRYVIEMKNNEKVMSSKSYASLIKAMIKLN